MKKFISFLLTVSLLLLAACGNGGGNGGGNANSEGNANSGGNGNQDPILIGSLHPISGSMAYDGNLFVEAQQMAIDEINAAGGIKNLGGRPLELVVYDTQNDASKAVTGVQKLINDGCLVLTGTSSSSTAKTALPEAEKEGVPFVVTSAALANIFDQNFKYCFRPQAHSNTFAYDCIEYLKEIKTDDMKTVAFIHEESAYGVDVARIVAEACGDMGLTPVIDISYDVSSSTLVPEITRLQQANPDILITTGYYNDQSMLYRECLERGLKLKLYLGIGSGSICDPKFITEFGETANLLCDVNLGVNLGSDAYQELADHFKERTGEPISLTAAYCYVAIEVIADALERTASDSYDDIAQALRETDMTLDFLPNPRIAFDEKGENIYAKSIMTQIQGGKNVIIMPREAAQAEFILPY